MSAENNQTNQPKSKGRGGARPNAGRKKGMATIKTREIADRVMAEAEQNCTPLEIMMKIMNAFMEQAEQVSDAEQKTKLMRMAKDAAASAAPYVHPRLAAIDHTTNGKDMAQSHGVLVAPGTQSEEEWESQK